MERSNQPPKPECCLQRGQEPESPGMTAPNDLREAYTGQKRGPQAGFASCLSNSASKCLAADGDGLGMPEPNTDRAVAGEALEGLPGSKSVARAAEAARNQGDPEGSRRTNYERQAGSRLTKQRREGEADGPRGQRPLGASRTDPSWTEFARLAHQAVVAFVGTGIINRAEPRACGHSRGPRCLKLSRAVKGLQGLRQTEPVVAPGGRGTVGWCLQPYRLCGQVSYVA